MFYFFSVCVLSDSQETSHLSHVMISHVMIMADMKFSHLTQSMRSLKPSLEFDKNLAKEEGRSQASLSGTFLRTAGIGYASVQLSTNAFSTL